LSLIKKLIILHNKKSIDSKIFYINYIYSNEFFLVKPKIFILNNFVKLDVKNYIFSILLYYIFFCGIKIDGLNKYVLSNYSIDFNRLVLFIKLAYGFSKLAVILYICVVKLVKHLFFSSYAVKYNNFFLKKFVYFNLVSTQKLFFYDIIKHSCIYLYYTIALNNNTKNTLSIIQDDILNKHLSKNYFNILCLCQNLYKKNYIYSNYNLLLLKQYINNFNSFESVTMTSISDSKIIVKKFGFFEFFLKKFLEETIQSKILLTFTRNDIDFLLNNQYYLMFVKRIKKLQIFNKDINLVRELIEVLVVTMYTYDVACFKNWLIKVAEKIHFKLHKRLFYIIKIIISKYFNLYFKYFGCLGFCLRVQGKIGLGGSSKTRSF
jgi:hypothetical protein